MVRSPHKAVSYTHLRAEDGLQTRMRERARLAIGSQAIRALKLHERAGGLAPWLAIELAHIGVQPTNQLKQLESALQGQ